MGRRVRSSDDGTDGGSGDGAAHDISYLTVRKLRLSVTTFKDEASTKQTINAIIHHKQLE